MSILAIDIGGSKLLAGCVDAAGHVHNKVRIPLPTGITQQGLLDVIRQAATELGSIKFTAVGVTIPGLADAKNGIWVHAPFSGIGNFPIADELNKMFGIPVYIENDVNACALAEKHFGICKNIDDYIWVTISNGIGGSIVSNNRLFTGYAGNAGEIGHFNVEETSGNLCGCGNTGCLEVHAGGPAIAKLYTSLSGKAATQSKEVGELARAGDINAIKTFEKVGAYIGRALSYAVNFVNPEAVILGGGVMMDGDLLLPTIEQIFNNSIFAKANKDVKIYKTALGYDAALLGAATLGLLGGTTK